MRWTLRWSTGCLEAHVTGTAVPQISTAKRGRGKTLGLIGQSCRKVFVLFHLAALLSSALFASCCHHTSPPGAGCQRNSKLNMRQHM
jgi:hypothetical protein